MATSITVRSHKDVSCPTALHPHVALCVDARSVRPSPLKATASSWFDNGRSDRASLQQSSRCVHYVKPIRHPVVDKTKHHPVGTHGLCVRCSTARRDIVVFLTGTDAQTERSYRESFCFVDNYSSRLCASLQRDTRIIVTRQVVTRCGVVSQLLLLLRRISSMHTIYVFPLLQ